MHHKYDITYPKFVANERTVDWLHTAIAEGAMLTLKHGNKSMNIRIAVPDQLQWNIIPVKQLMNKVDSYNPDAKMLCFEAVAPADGNLNFEVIFTPGSVQGKQPAK